MQAAADLPWLAARGDSYDNALAGMISRLYKTELTPSIMDEPRGLCDSDPDMDALYATASVQLTRT
jgi:hypothetical protein